MFQVGDAVEIMCYWTPTTGVVKTALTLINYPHPQYGVLPEGSTEIEYYYEWDLRKLDTPKNSRCECGAAKLGHPGHSHYCPEFKA